MATNDYVPHAPGYVDNEGQKIVTSRFIHDDSFTLARYEATGGYEALRKAFEIGPEAITEEMKASNLRGRGGANFPAGVPGRGRYVADTASQVSVGVINVMGRVFMNPLDNPFHVVRDELDAVRNETRVILVDFHAEATSEKLAMGWHLDGLVTAVVGTHTHVQTADERVLPQGTAYITDVGMTGPHDSIIGVNTRPALQRFLDGMPSRFETATGNPRFNAVVITADPTTGKATQIERISLSTEDVEASVADSVST